MHRRGFTLIELLVVIAIIGLLTSVVLVSLNSARAKARDARRVQDITQIQRAIELYIEDNGHAPSLANDNCLLGTWVTDCFAAETQLINNPLTGGNWVILEGELSPYLSSLPRDPCGAGCYGDRFNSFSEEFFAYYYAAPGSMAPEMFPDDFEFSAKTYRIYAQNTETGISGFGFGPGSFLGGY